MRSPEDAALWARLQALELDVPGAALPFTARLARENGWSRAFARRAVEEYRRFLLLTVTSERPLTPSVEVDQVWHLHLLYTRSYWDELCGRVLGRPLHHDPTRGGAREGARYHDQYAATLARYRDVFGEAPPVDLWPPPDVRMARESLVRQVSARTHWVVAKPRAPRWGALVGACLVLAGCTVADAGVAGLIAAAFTAPALVYVAMRPTGSGPHPPPDARGDGASPGHGAPLGGATDDAGDVGGGCGGSGCGGCGGGCGT